MSGITFVLHYNGQCSPSSDDGVLTAHACIFRDSHCDISEFVSKAGIHGSSERIVRSEPEVEFMQIVGGKFKSFTIHNSFGCFFAHCISQVGVV